MLDDAIIGNLSASLLAIYFWVATDITELFLI